MNNWIDTATNFLKRSLKPVPQELNEIDWKTNLSDKSDRLAKHISAFANTSGGGYLAFGINNNGDPEPLSKEDMDLIIQKLGNMARNNLAQPIAIDHAVITYNEHPVLLIHIPEHQDKPVYLRSGNMYDSYKRSAGQTIKLSKHEIKHLVAFSSGFEFEEQIAYADVESNEVVEMIDFDSYFTLQEKRYCFKFQTFKTKKYFCISKKFHY